MKLVRDNGISALGNVVGEDGDSGFGGNVVQLLLSGEISLDKFIEWVDSDITYY